MAFTLHTLNRLLQKNSRWRWKAEQKKAFTKSKGLLTLTKFLVHFDPSLPLTLAWNVSDYGVGAVLAHHMAYGFEKPIGYAPQTLTKAECNYSQ